MAEAPIFLEKLYTDTLQLLKEARSYIAYAEGTNEKLETRARLRVSYETLRVTARLSQIMTWLLTEKAVLAGEIPLDQARGGGFSIYGGDFCAEDPQPADMEIMPDGLKDLLDRTASLYQRCLRLEQMLKDSARA